MTTMLRDAIISDDKQYRYRLMRRWDVRLPAVAWIMLNPSTADDTQDDPTIRRVIGFSRLWGYGGVQVVNLFAYRATDPKELATVADPTGPDNDTHIIDAIRIANTVVGAWGSSGDYATRYLRRGRIREIAQQRLAPIWCLGVTKSGDPRHPLYIAYETELQRWA